MPLSELSTELPAACRRSCSPHLPWRAGRPERESHKGGQAGKWSGTLQGAAAQDGVLQGQSGGWCSLINASPWDIHFDYICLELRKIHWFLNSDAAILYMCVFQELKEDNRVLQETKEVLEDQLAGWRARSDKIHQLEKHSLLLKARVHDMEQVRHLHTSRSVAV